MLCQSHPDGTPGIAESVRKLARRALGLSEYEKLPRTCSAVMCKLLRAENDQPITCYPGSFDSLVEVCEGFESAPKPKLERRNLIITANHEKFFFHVFPKICTGSAISYCAPCHLPTTLDTIQVGRPAPAAVQRLSTFLA
ncbi:hypothetical protein [Pseudomonas sp. NPDC087336]|uniref:hypothetical protein n=1 Tax=Pseudomonas sp. NPDC087336 TaxID=3364436 RepID=UPI00380520D2